MQALDEIIDKVFKSTFAHLRNVPRGHSSKPLAMIFNAEGMGVIPPPDEIGPNWREDLAEAIRFAHDNMGINAYLVGMEISGILNPAEDTMSREGYVITAGNETETVVRLWELRRDARSGRYIGFLERKLPHDLNPMSQFADLLRDQSEWESPFPQTGYMH